MSLEDAFRKTVNRLEGAYAIVLTSVDSETYFARAKRAPLCWGLERANTTAVGLCSIPSTYTKRQFFSMEGEMAVLNRTGGPDSQVEECSSPSIGSPITISWDPESAKKQGFRHFMLKEIHEQAQSLGTPEDGAGLL